MAPRKRKPRKVLVDSRRIARQLCPACSAPLDAITGIELDRSRGRVEPLPGVYVVCIDCGTINVFDDALRVRLVTRDELRDVPPIVRSLSLAVRRDRPSRRGFFQ